MTTSSSITVVDVDVDAGFTSSEEDDDDEEKFTPMERTVSSLSAYYNTPSMVNGNQEMKRSKSYSRSRTPSSSHGEMKYEFNSKYFDSNAFVEKKVSDLCVNDLVEYSNELNRDIKSLDSEMQMMVYDNYNKFISATDTIRKMKDQVENMENEMNILLNNMNDIASKCEVIENGFEPNRTEIEKLVGVGRLLKRLEFLFELPHRLRKSINLEHYEQAVKYYQISSNILQKYEDIKSFRDINIESREIIDELQQNMKYQMIQSGISTVRQLEFASLLLQLKEPAEYLWYDILRTRKDWFFKCILQLKDENIIHKYYEQQDIQQSKESNRKLFIKEEEINDEQKNESKEEKNEQKIESKENILILDSNPFADDIQSNGNTKIREMNIKFFSVVDYFRKQFLSMFIDFVEKYTAVFVTPYHLKHMKEKKSKEVNQRHKSFSSSSTSSSVSPFASRSQSQSMVSSTSTLDKMTINQSTYEKSIAALTAFTRQVFTEYFNVIKSCLQREKNIEKLTEELQLFYDGLYLPSRLVPNAKLRDRGTEIIEVCIRKSMQCEFIHCRKEQMSHLLEYLKYQCDISLLSSAFHATEMEERKISLDEHCKRCVNDVKKLMITCLDKLIPLTTNQSELIPILDLNFDNQLWQYTTNMFRIFTEIIPIEMRLSSDEYFDSMSNNNRIFNAVINATTDEDYDILRNIRYQLIGNVDECGDDVNENTKCLEPIKLLILAKIFLGISETVVESTVSHFRRNFLFDKNMNLYKQEILLLKSCCEECASGLRLMYCESICESLYSFIDDMEFDPIMKDIRTNADIEQRNSYQIEIQKRLKLVFENLCKIYVVSDDQLLTYCTKRTESVNKRDFDKIFMEGCLIYDVVLDSASSILFTIYKILFKYWSMRLRTLRINDRHLKCIEFNIDSFRDQIPKIINMKDFGRLETLLDEVEQSARERCVFNTATVIGSITGGGNAIDDDEENENEEDLNEVIDIN